MYHTCIVFVCTVLYIHTHILLAADATTKSILLEDVTASGKNVCLARGYKLCNLYEYITVHEIGADSLIRDWKISKILASLSHFTRLMTKGESFKKKKKKNHSASR